MWDLNEFYWIFSCLFKVEMGIRQSQPLESGATLSLASAGWRRRRDARKRRAAPLVFNSTAPAAAQTESSIAFRASRPVSSRRLCVFDPFDGFVVVNRFHSSALSLLCHPAPAIVSIGCHGPSFPSQSYRHSSDLVMRF